MTDLTITGLRNIGNICFLNSMMQCLASVESIDDFLEVEVNGSSSAHRFLKMVQEEMLRMKNGGSILLKQELLEFVYFSIFKRKFNSEQDITELIAQFFEDLDVVAPQVYMNFGVLAQQDCPCGPTYANLHHSLEFNVQQDEYSIDIGEKLSNAVFLEYGQECYCMENRVHFYGEVPKCLIITVHKVTDFDRKHGCQFIRRDVQIKCEPIHRINGQDYEMKSAAEYVGKTGKGGGIVKQIRKLLCIPKNSHKKLEEELDRERVDSFLSSYEEIREATPPKPEPVLFEPKTSFVSSPTRSSQVQFRSMPRNLPNMTNLSGHYTSYVKRGEEYFFISDDWVQQTSEVKTDDLRVLFYERK